MKHTLVQGKVKPPWSWHCSFLVKCLQNNSAVATERDTLIHELVSSQKVNLNNLIPFKINGQIMNFYQSISQFSVPSLYCDEKGKSQALLQLKSVWLDVLSRQICLNKVLNEYKSYFVEFVSNKDNVSVCMFSGEGACVWETETLFSKRICERSLLKQSKENKSLKVPVCVEEVLQSRFTDVTPQETMMIYVHKLKSALRLIIRIQYPVKEIISSPWGCDVWAMHRYSFTSADTDTCRNNRAPVLCLWHHGPGFPYSECENYEIKIRWRIVIVQAFQHVCGAPGWNQVDRAQQ